MKDVKTGDFIHFGSGLLLKKAIVCSIYDSENIEVIYIDDRNRAINEDMVLKEGKWVFKHQGPCGGYADKYERLSDYVRRLRSSERLPS